MPVLSLPSVTLREATSGTGERAFAYTKACGIIGKSFIGKRESALEKLGSLQELDRLVFPSHAAESYHTMTGRELLEDIEERIHSRAVRHIRSVINAFSAPSPLLVRQLRSCEYADLKTCLHHLATGKAAPPALTNLGRFRTVRFASFPNLAAMLSRTEFAFILNKIPKPIKPADLTAVEIELDRHYYTMMAESACCNSFADDYLYARHILAEEIALRNCIWALRLRCYFNKGGDETAGHLINLRVSDEEGKDSFKGAYSLAVYALRSLRFPLDSRPAWNGWRWEHFLNPHNAGEHWTVDPRYFQNAASRHIYRLSLHYFRTMPFSVSSLFCFIKLKQYEENLLISIAEGLWLGMTGKDVFAMLEVSP